MATTLTYTTQPIATRVDPRGRYYARIESVPLSATETLRGVMAYKKITAYSESTVLQLLNDLLQGAVELTALDGKTRTLGQMLRVYMALEGSYATPILSASDKDNLVVRTQLLKDLKYPVDGSNFTLSPKESDLFRIINVHYSGQTTVEDAMKVGKETIITGRNFTSIPWDGNTEIEIYNPAVEDGLVVGSISESGYQPSINAVLLPAFVRDNTVLPGSPEYWDCQLRIGRASGDDVILYDTRDIKVYPADPVEEEGNE